MRRLFRDRRGATSIEYATIAFLVAVVVVGAITLVGSRMNSVWSRVAVAF